MKRWGILPEEFPKVDKNKFANSSEEVDIDDTEEQVANTIRRLEVLQEKEKEEEERAKDPQGRTKAEIFTDEECEKIKKWAIEEYPEVFKSVLGKEDRIRCEPVQLERKSQTELRRKKNINMCTYSYKPQEASGQAHQRNDRSRSDIRINRINRILLTWKIPT